jgi:hypothetical protein
MNAFYESLKNVDVDASIGIVRDTQTRDPLKKDPDLILKQKILANAPNKDQDNIIAEKKSW